MACLKLGDSKVYRSAVPIFLLLTKEFGVAWGMDKLDRFAVTAKSPALQAGGLRCACDVLTAYGYNLKKYGADTETLLRVSVHGINNPARNIRTQCLEFLKLCATFIGGSIIGLFFKKAGDKVSTALRSTIETDAKAAIKESKKNDGEEEEDAAEEAEEQPQRESPPPTKQIESRVKKPLRSQVSSKAPSSQRGRKSTTTSVSSSSNSTRRLSGVSSRVGSRRPLVDRRKEEEEDLFAIDDGDELIDDSCRVSMKNVFNPNDMATIQKEKNWKNRVEKLNALIREVKIAKHITGDFGHLTSFVKERFMGGESNVKVLQTITQLLILVLKSTTKEACNKHIPALTTPIEMQFSQKKPSHREAAKHALELLLRGDHSKGMMFVLVGQCAKNTSMPKILSNILIKETSQPAKELVMSFIIERLGEISVEEANGPHIAHIKKEVITLVPVILKRTQDGSHGMREKAYAVMQEVARLYGQPVVGFMKKMAEKTMSKAAQRSLEAVFAKLAAESPASIPKSSDKPQSSVQSSSQGSDRPSRSISVKSGQSSSTSTSLASSSLASSSISSARSHKKSVRIANPATSISIKSSSNALDGERTKGSDTKSEPLKAGSMGSEEPPVGSEATPDQQAQSTLVSAPQPKDSIFSLEGLPEDLNGISFPSVDAPMSSEVADPSHMESKVGGASRLMARGVAVMATPHLPQRSLTKEKRNGIQEQIETLKKCNEMTNPWSDGQPPSHNELVAYAELQELLITTYKRLISLCSSHSDEFMLFSEDIVTITIESLCANMLVSQPIADRLLRYGITLLKRTFMTPVIAQNLSRAILKDVLFFLVAVMLDGGLKTLGPAGHALLQYEGKPYTPDESSGKQMLQRLNDTTYAILQNANQTAVLSTFFQLLRRTGHALIHPQKQVSVATRRKMQRIDAAWQHPDHLDKAQVVIVRCVNMMLDGVRLALDDLFERMESSLSLQIELEPREKDIDIEDVMWNLHVLLVAVNADVLLENDSLLAVPRENVLRAHACAKKVLGTIKDLLKSRPLTLTKLVHSDSFPANSPVITFLNPSVAPSSFSPAPTLYSSLSASNRLASILQKTPGRPLTATTPSRTPGSTRGRLGPSKDSLKRARRAISGDRSALRRPHSASGGDSPFVSSQSAWNNMLSDEIVRVLEGGRSFDDLFQMVSKKASQDGLPVREYISEILPKELRSLGVELGENEF
ncbi:hypothetical protein ADUPG1_011950, partial [Aduncisulcus paluster]